MNTNEIKNKKRLIIYFMFMIATMIFIFYCSSKEATESQAASDATLEIIINTVGRTLSDSMKLLLEEYIRKIAHFTIYLILGIFSHLTIREWKQSEYSKRLIAEFAFIFSMVYAITDEFHQKFVAGRSCEWNDVGIDSLGALCGIIISFTIIKLSKKALAK